jgi:glutamate-ammonia-ligase adenylyltransferase
MVWHASTRENFVADVQAMRRRVEQHIPPAEAARQLKLGAGGLRDVEFSVQLLQLVHGRTDESLRTGTTLDGLAALSAGGYVGREDAATLATAYRLLRTLEHRIQLYRLRRTHLMPTAASDLRRLGRALGHRSSPADAVIAQWKAQQREVRRLHERIFYHPLLSAVARLSDSDVRLTPEAAEERSVRVGFPRSAWRAPPPRGLTDGSAAGRDPAPAAAGDARLVRRRGRPGCRPARLPQDQRRARDDPLVPAAAARRGLGRRAARAQVLRSRFAAGLLEQAPECGAVPR